jgi:xylan 1,4-beta-xylosidase
MQDWYYANRGACGKSLDKCGECLSAEIMTTRQSILGSVLIAAAFAAQAGNAQQLPAADAARVAQVRLERQPVGDLGNGYFRNPILVPGSDNSVIRVGKDYYMLHGAGGVPLLMVWHSRDLVNWRPMSRAAEKPLGGSWAPDIAYYKGKYYIYTTLVDPNRGDAKYRALTPAQRSLVGYPTKDSIGDTGFMNVVMWANSPAGPWSDPIDLKIYGLIDPGHVADEQGNRYLYTSRGMVIKLAPDGLSTVGELKKAYDGWQYPKDWAVECMCLEAPKLTFHNGYYYLVSAQGGTAGPQTAHMAVVARSKSPEGPWENSPMNPIVRTSSREEKWWRQGHGTLIDDAAGQWWLLYTGYENGYANVYPKQNLLLPIEWVDGWPRVPAGVSVTDVFRMPAGENVGAGMPLSDDFTATARGIQWSYRLTGDPAGTYRFGDSMLRIKAGGKLPSDAPAVSVRPVNKTFEVTVDVQIPETASAGLMIGGSGDWSIAALRKGEAFSGQPKHLYSPGEWLRNRVLIRMRYDRGDVTAHCSGDGKTWTKFDNSTDVPGRPTVSLWASGEGEVIFRNFQYRGLD